MSSITPLGPVAAAVDAVTYAGPHFAASPAPSPGPAPQGQNRQPASPTPEQVKAAVDAANQALDQSSQEFAFVFDDKLNRILVKIVDTRTNTVIRQIPSEDMLAAARALAGPSPRGALLNSKA